VLVKYMTLMLGLLVVLAFGVRPALRRAAMAEKDRGNAAVNGKPRELTAHSPGPPPAALNAPEPALPDPERVRAQEILEQVSGHLKREPAQSSRLLQSWIHSE